tara:strand:+ start:309 stop:563 length:255 start_codon:yes stop_codon:yes gene_type:complete
LINSKKKNCVEIKKIKGKILKSVEGVLSAVSKKGKEIFTSISLKKEISSKTLKINTKVKNIDETLIIFFAKSIIKYFSKVFIIY